MSRNIIFFSSLILTLIISACTGLSGEPEIVATVPQPTSVVETPEEDSLFPQSKPDITNGAQIFAERCTECHSETGNGLGALVLEGGIPQPPDMTDVSATSRKTPLAWYNTITNGNLEFLMPPWKNALTTQERWDVAFYTYTLGYDENMLILGEQVWADKCNGCESLSGLIDLESAVTISDTSFGNQIDRNDFNSTLSTGEIYAAAAYARSLSVENPTSIASIPISEDPNIKHGNFTGVVEHGTAGSTVPTDTLIQMQYGNMQNGFEFAQTTIHNDFTYTFEDIPLTTAFTYNVGAIYRDRLYTSTLMEGHPEGTDYNQTLTIYDLTDDTFVLSVSQIDMFIDSIDVPDLGSGLSITQVIRYNNSSDRMYTSGKQIGDGREAILLIQVPVGAIITSDEANGRYIIVQDIENVPDSIIDTYSVQPGDNHDVFVEYFVPYEDGAIIDQPFNNVINGDVTITLSNNLTVVSDDFTQSEDSNIPENLLVYTGNLNIDAQPALVFEITGNPFVPPSQDEIVIATDTLFPILLGGIVLITIVIIVIIAIAGRGNDDRHNIDALIKQIAELDTMHDNGQINHDVYQRQRQELKQQLTNLMQPNTTSEDA